MNEGMIVRMDTDGQGVNLRVWVDDEFGRHVCTCEVFLDAKRIGVIAREVGLAQQAADQYQLKFD